MRDIVVRKREVFCDRCHGSIKQGTCAVADYWDGEESVYCFDCSEQLEDDENRHPFDGVQE